MVETAIGKCSKQRVTRRREGEWLCAMSSELIAEQKSGRDSQAAGVSPAIDRGIENQAECSAGDVTCCGVLCCLCRGSAINNVLGISYPEGIRSVVKWNSVESMHVVTHCQACDTQQSRRAELS